jgi:hypothetical protein
MNKKSSSSNYKLRKEKTREVRQRFLIICEGEKTEPNYFKCFQAPTLVIIIKGTGKSPLEIISEAKNKTKDDDYDQVWCVFDRDNWEESQFEEAIAQAEKEEFKVAYSNESFELWYLLHFEFINTAIPRKDYQKKLTTLLKKTYTKNSEDMYEKLQDKQTIAIRNAEKLIQTYKPPNPAKDNPSTTVYLLVEELNKHIY